MTNKKRWIEAVVETAEKMDKPLPWTRGAPRREMIANRKDEEPAKRSA